MKTHLKVLRAVITALALLAGIVGMTQPAAAAGGPPGPRTAVTGGGPNRNVDWQF